MTIYVVVEAVEYEGSTVLWVGTDMVQAYNICEKLSASCAYSYMSGVTYAVQCYENNTPSVYGAALLK